MSLTLVAVETLPDFIFFKFKRFRFDIVVRACVRACVFLMQRASEPERVRVCSCAGRCACAVLILNACALAPAPT